MACKLGRGVGLRETECYSLSRDVATDHFGLSSQVSAVCGPALRLEVGVLT